AGPLAGASKAHWVRPELVAQVAFGEWTSDGRLRHPSFQGLREDKPAREVVRERSRDVADAASDDGASTAKPRARAGRASGRTTRAAARPRARASAAEAEDRVAGVPLTHPDRILYPEQGITKRDLALYYASIADRVLPHLVGRPLTLVRCPDGAHATCF